MGRTFGVTAAPVLVLVLALMVVVGAIPAVAQEGRGGRTGPGGSPPQQGTGERDAGAHGARGGPSTDGRKDRNGGGAPQVQFRGSGTPDDDRRGPGHDKDRTRRDAPGRTGRDEGADPGRGGRDDDRRQPRGQDQRRRDERPDEDRVDRDRQPDRGQGRPPRDADPERARDPERERDRAPQGAASPPGTTPDGGATVTDQEPDATVPGTSDGAAVDPDADEQRPQLMGAGGFLQGNLGWLGGPGGSGPFVDGPTAPGPGTVGGLPVLLALLGAFLALQRGIGQGLGHVPMADTTELQVPHERP